MNGINVGGGKNGTYFLLLIKDNENWQVDDQ